MPRKQSDDPSLEAVSIAAQRQLALDCIGETVGQLRRLAALIESTPEFLAPGLAGEAVAVCQRLDGVLALAERLAAPPAQTASTSPKATGESPCPSSS